MKIKLVGMKHASTEYGNFERDQVVEFPDDVAKSFLSQDGMWEVVTDSKSTKVDNKKLDAPDTK